MFATMPYMYIFCKINVNKTLKQYSNKNKSLSLKKIEILLELDLWVTIIRLDSFHYESTYGTLSKYYIAYIYNLE